MTEYTDWPRLLASLMNRLSGHLAGKRDCRKLAAIRRINTEVDWPIVREACTVTWILDA
jgi:hypothetical protein